MTADEVLALESDERVDRWLFSGELIERRYDLHSPGHAGALVAVMCLLDGWCRSMAGAGLRAFGYRCPYLLGRAPDTIVSFDASVIAATLAPTLRQHATYIDGVPLLAVEVMDLDDDPKLIERLVDESLRCGVQSFWVVDPLDELVLSYRLGAEPEYVKGPLDWIPGPHLPGLCIPLAELFED
jgi:Putative restriction endonuclease